MAKPKHYAKEVSYISVSSSKIISSLSSSSLQYLLLSPKKQQPINIFLFCFNCVRSPKLWFFAFFLFGFLGMLRLCISPYPCVPNTALRFGGGGEGIELENGGPLSDNGMKSGVGFVSSIVKGGENAVKEESLLVFTHPEGLILNGYPEFDDSSEFWNQPDGLGYRPCLEFSKEYMKQSEEMVKDRSKYLLVVVSGGLNQQRNQIVDAVVIARILGAALVVPILQVNQIWGDESEFSDIFDFHYFKSVLANDVRIVSSLPSTLLMRRPGEEKLAQVHVSPQWIRARYLKRLNRDGVLLLRGLDSRLSKELPSDLQKLRCKVAFQALRFAPRILELGNKLVERMRSKGPYLALHLRMEKDVWVRTGCLPGLSPEYDEIINNERKQRPELLTGRSNLTCHERKLAGLCPLNALEVTRLLKALGAPKNVRIYWAGGKPLGGEEALLPLTSEFHHFYNKEDIALPGELEPYRKKASLMAAIDYIVSVNSDVFMASHGGNMGHAIQGQRAYAGHKKYITPNKRHMLPYFVNASLPEAEFNRIIKELHQDSTGQPEMRTTRPGRDVTKYPIPECMCSDTRTYSS